MSSPAEPETLRLHQANERTMLAWLRTGIALMAFGFAIARFGVFLRQVASMTTHAPRGLDSAWVGIALVAGGMVTSLSATLRSQQVRKAIERGSTGAPSAAAVYVIGIMVTLIGLGMSILLARALGD